MRVPVIRKKYKFYPDSSRVVIRYFNSDQRNLKMIGHIMLLDEKSNRNLA
jgi:hypothetical protein